MKSERAILQNLLDRCVHGADSLIQHLPPAEEGGFPVLNQRTGQWETGRFSFWGGFLAGRLWLLYALTREERFADAALEVSLRVAPLAEFAAIDTGFAIYHSAALGYDLTGDDRLKAVALRGAESLASLWNERAGVVTLGSTEHQRQLGLGFPYDRATDRETLIDVGATLRLLWWAGRFDPRYHDLALRHQLGVLSIGLVRPDFRTYHAVKFNDDFSPSEFFTHQGYSPDSQWARGMAWAILGYTQAFIATGRAEFHQTAVGCADWFLAHLPSNESVPFYDFDDPAIPHLPRDSCSAAIVATALGMLTSRTQVTPEQAAYAPGALRELANNYVTPCGVALYGCWGRAPGKEPEQTIMPYGNYFLVEALYHQLRPESTQVTPALARRE